MFHGGGECVIFGVPAHTWAVLGSEGEMMSTVVVTFYQNDDEDRPEQVLGIRVHSVGGFDVVSGDEKIALVENLQRETVGGLDGSKALSPLDGLRWARALQRKYNGAYLWASAPMEE